MHERKTVALQRVADPRQPGWVYTIGLVEHADHPELIVAGAPFERSADLLEPLARAALEGERLEVGNVIMIGDEAAHVGAVHPIQFRLDTFANWHNLQNIGALGDRPLKAVQVLTPASWTVGKRRQPVLAQPFATVDVRQSRHHGGRSRNRRKR